MTIRNNGIPSSTWCAYPWQHSYIGSRYERKICCISKDAVGFEKTPTSEFWNSDFMKSVRTNMLAGEKIAECKVCYECEQANNISLRQHVNNNITKDMLSDYLDKTEVDGYYHGVVTYYDYRTIHCNLQCQSCGDIYSSQHIKLKEKMFGDKIIATDKDSLFKIDYEYEKECTDEIISSIRNKQVTTIYWAGGEPMMSPIHWEVIEYMLEKLDDPAYVDYIKTIQMHYNTNLTKLYWKNKSIPKLLELLQPVLQPSLDGTHETIEYTRDGVTWEEIDKNFNEYINLLNKFEQFGIATVTSAPVLFDLDRYLEYYSRYKVRLVPHYHFCSIETPTSMSGLLSIKQYPEDIFFPAIQNAKKKLKLYNLPGTSEFIDILTRYEKEYADLRSKNIINKEYLEKVKGGQVYRDSFNFTKRSLTDLYAITNTSAKEWVDSIGIRATNLQQETYFIKNNIPYIRGF